MKALNFTTTIPSLTLFLSLFLYVGLSFWPVSSSQASLSGSDGKGSAPRQETWVCQVGKIPREEWLTTPVSCLEENSMDRGAQGRSPRVTKSGIQLTTKTFYFSWRNFNISLQDWFPGNTFLYTSSYWESLYFSPSLWKDNFLWMQNSKLMRFFFPPQTKYFTALSSYLHNFWEVRM